MKSIKIVRILKKIIYLDFKGNSDQVINEIIPLSKDNEHENILSWCSDKNIKLLSNVKTGTFVVSKNVSETVFNDNCNFIIVENPRDTFRSILEIFFLEKQEPIISKSAIINNSVKLGKNLYIGENVVIEENCRIGDNVTIMHNTVLLKNTIIEDSVYIGSNNTIGGTGFGYEKDENGNFKPIPHLGNVIIRKNVEIGNNTCIDRAVLESTIINENVKIDNLVHIAHGVEIGKNSLIIANAMIAGSVNIGYNSWIAPSSSVLNQKSIGNNSIIGMGAVVLSDVEDFSVVVGNPAKLINKKSK